jgi:hypothetical protein
MYDVGVPEFFDDGTHKKGVSYQLSALSLNLRGSTVRLRANGLASGVELQASTYTS